jgi:hypothetical protein
MARRGVRLALLREVNRQDAEVAKFRTDFINVSGLALLAPWRFKSSGLSLILVSSCRMPGVLA